MFCELLKRGKTRELKTIAATAVGHFAATSSGYRSELETNGAIKALVALLETNLLLKRETLTNADEAAIDEQLDMAAVALADIAAVEEEDPDASKHDHTYRKAIREAHGVPALVALVRDGTPSQKMHAAGALENLADDPDNDVAIREAGGIEPLVTLAKNGSNVPAGTPEAEADLIKSGADVAAGALANLSDNKENERIMKDLGWPPVEAMSVTA